VKAIVYSEFGPPAVLALADIDRPTPKPDEVLVKIRAAAANPLDWHFIRGEPPVMRLMGKPHKRVPGVDFSGQVEAVGANVTLFHVGDDVFGMGSGTFAEYACASSKTIARKPSALTHEQAAAIPVAGTTALIALRDKGELRAGQRVLVVGAAGGVGTFGVQIAKALGAHVTGVCSTKNLELVRSLGADDVIDHTADDFADGRRHFDLVLHVAGNRSLADHRRALTRDGTLVLVGGGIGRDTGGSQTLATLRALALVTARRPFSRFLRQRIRMFVATARPSDLAYLAELCESGKVTPHVERTYRLEETPEAIRHIESGHARGKLVVVPKHAA
jgi:NADPH:quinone reductase-like Zn-dependent oxidoreductase